MQTESSKRKIPSHHLSHTGKPVVINHSPFPLSSSVKTCLVRTRWSLCGTALPLLSCTSSEREKLRLKEKKKSRNAFTKPHSEDPQPGVPRYQRSRGGRTCQVGLRGGSTQSCQPVLVPCGSWLGNKAGKGVRNHFTSALWWHTAFCAPPLPAHTLFSLKLQPHYIWAPLPTMVCLKSLVHHTHSPLPPSHSQQERLEGGTL